MWAAPSMLQDSQHAGCGPHVRLNDWLGRSGRLCGEAASDARKGWLLKPAEN